MVVSFKTMQAKVKFSDKGADVNLLRAMGFKVEDELLCAVCRVELTQNNIAKRENGIFRSDVLNRLWCIRCTNEHDDIDWDDEK